MLGEALVIFKTRSIWLAFFTGDSDIPFIFRKSRSAVGCVSGQSIQESKNGLVFRSDDGYYFFDGNNSFKLSDRVTTTLGTFNAGRYKNVVSAYHITKGRYISSESSSANTTHNRNMTWTFEDGVVNAWSVYGGLNANCFARVYNSGVEQIYFGDYAGFVYLTDTTSTDNPSGTATAIDAYYYSKWFDYGELVLKKAAPVCKIYHQFSSSTLTFAYSYNFESQDQYSQTFSMSAGASLYGTATYDTSTYVGVGGNVKERDLTGRGETIRFGFKNNVVGEDFTIDAFGSWVNAETV